MIENHAQLWEQKLTHLLCDPEGEPLARIRNYVVEAMQGLENYAFRCGCLIGNMGQELGGLDDEFRQRIPRVFGDWAESLAACLREAQHAGERNAGVDRLAAFFWFSWEGAILQAKSERFLQPIEQFRDVMFHKVLTP